MKRQRKGRILSIVALLLTITGMTLGFAGFSTTLNISSNANVTPNSEDFKVRLVGPNGDNKMLIYNSTVLGNEPVFIERDGLTISGLRVKLTGPGDAVSYYAFLENSGLYDAYFAAVNVYPVPGEATARKCTPALENGASLELLDDVCLKMSMSYSIYECDQETGEKISTKSLPRGSVIRKGKKYLFILTLKYKEDTPYVDGDFEIIYGDVEFVFSSTL